jgi:methionine-rich copper-binding protein CopC
MRSHVFRVIVMCGLGFALGLAPQVGAVAHSQLLESTPADGAVLTVAPERVELTFNESLIPKVDTIAINDDRGNVVSTLQAQPEGATISAPWPVGLPAGTYQVAYRVVSGDGHPVTGAITFTITASGASTSEVTGASTPALPEPSASPASSTASAEQMPILWVGGVIALVLIVALLLFAVVRGRRPR